MITIISVGKLKEKYLNDGINEYLKRLSKYMKVELIEVEDVSFDKEKTLKEEARNIQKRLNLKSYIITLEIDGKELTSLELSDLINKTSINNSDITFIIGGSYGLDDSIKQLSNYKLSFSKLTFPHQLFRLILLEQIYRSYKIINNETYHK
ncbi:putative ribosomal RNA large subunit methyltransferase H [Clostridium sp. CAG:1193]|nr:putative ribosomal RNA large subunit methyltransferase H [Clostridium sp. CAG:1193]